MSRSGPAPASRVFRWWVALFLAALPALLPAQASGPLASPVAPGDTSTRDAALARLAAAREILLGSALGRAGLDRYARSGYAIVFATPAERDANARGAYARATGRPPDFVTDHPRWRVVILDDTLPPAVLAVGLTHEAVHVIGRAVEGTRHLGDEELEAWERALDLYAALDSASHAAAAPKYAAYAEWRAREPQAFAEAMRCVYPGTPGCAPRQAP